MKLITKNGYNKLQAEISHLKSVERLQIIEAIATARELGDLKENAEYHSAKDKQGLIEAKIASLESSLSGSQVFNPDKNDSSVVGFSATVTIKNKENQRTKTYKIVNEYEADLDSGLISVDSPVARSLLRCRQGEDVIINTPKGKVQYKILNIKY
jgi:transcription elongation factor GreA